jgi:uncharacterized delta-60 repeat protein
VIRAHRPLHATMMAVTVAWLLAVDVMPAHAMAGTLDPSFGGNGWITTKFHDCSTVRALALQTDGKIVTAGELCTGGFALARFNPDGSPDATFGGDGKVTTGFGPNGTQAFGVAIQHDGRIVAVGFRYTDSSGLSGQFALARYDPDGSLDATFGGDGKVTTGFGDALARAYDAGVQSDGKIVVAGQGSTDTSALARYNPDGSLDATFGRDGKVITSASSIMKLAVQTNGRIVTVGASVSGGDGRLTLLRYMPDGSVDRSFGGNGKVTTRFRPHVAVGTSVAIQPDGKVVAAGLTYDTASFRLRFALARFLSDGTLDPAFSRNGKVVTKFPHAFASVQSVALQADGKIIAAGNAQTAEEAVDRFALARYDPHGNLDVSFGGDGRVTRPRGSFVAEVAIQADDRIVAAGGALVARYLGS